MSFLPPQSGQLNEYTERKEMSADVVCMSLANVPPGEQRSRFLAVGLVDNTVRIISLDPSVRAKEQFDVLTDRHTDRQFDTGFSEDVSS